MSHKSKTTQKHNLPNKHCRHVVGAACPSRDVDLMNSCRLRGGRPCACFVTRPPSRDLINSNDQGFTRSHWTPTLGNHSLCIAPAATRATYNNTTMQNVPTLLVVSMTIAMRRYNTVCTTQWRRFVAFIKATTRHHRVSSHSNSINQTHQRQLLLLFHCEKGLAFTCWPLITIGV